MRFTHDLLGEVEVMDSPTAMINLHAVEQHIAGERLGDLAMTMATMGTATYWEHHGFGLKLTGYDRVKENYAMRFRLPAAPFRIQSTVVTETAAFVQLDSGPEGSIPTLVRMECSDGKLSESIFSRQLSAEEIALFRRTWGQDPENGEALPR
jgi:hypothetical protein